MSIAAFQRQKPTATQSQRRLSAFRPASVLGKAQAAAAAAAAHANEILDPDAKEFFSGERFKHGRDVNGLWRSRYRSQQGDTQGWRMENKMRTVAAALCMCLNIGTDPPGIDRPCPCATLECWIDPNALQPPAKSLELIGSTLQQQYARWHPKAKYEMLLDPTSGAVKRMCVALRNSSARERILFHYNGHGVPRPTVNGEIWVFDKSYTLYVPLSIYDLLTWLGGPTLLVLDCSAAGALVENFQLFLRQKADETRAMMQQDPEKARLLPDYSECILLGACSANQSLPLTPSTLPMDLFTSCLLTPLKIALKFFAANSVFGGAASFDAFMTKDGNEELIDKIPGKTGERKTPLGELNWIYTAITDTIAWSILPQEMFQKLFRQDMLLASLLRNFLLATRILAHFDCTTVSLPVLPGASLIAKHPMWASWDLCCEQYLLSLDKYLNFQKLALAATAAGGVAPVVRFPREHINFFSEHLLAFEVWLEVGTESMGPPMQLPIVLQVLLSVVHRRRALILLARFIGKGKWAVQQALSVGIFPYVLKLLQSPDLPLREVLIFIWSKVLAFDLSTQVDVVKERHEVYFVNHLATPHSTGPGAVTDRQRVMSGYVLSSLCDGYPTGQRAVLRTGALGVAASHLDSESPSLRKWMCLLLGKMWDALEEARALAASQGIPEKLCGVIADPVPEVRAAALFALGTFMRPLACNTQEVPITRDRQATELMLAKNFSQLVVDASPLVREELALALVHLIDAQKEEFIQLVAQDRQASEEQSNQSSGPYSVPQSPLNHSLASPGLYSYPSGVSSPVQSAFSPSVVGSSLMSGAGSSYVPPSVLGSTPGVTSPALRSSQVTQQPAFTRSTSESGSHVAHGLAISLSPTMMAGQGGKTTTPLSPLHLQTWTAGGLPTPSHGSRSASSSASGLPPGLLVSPPTPHGSLRGGHSMLRASSIPTNFGGQESVQYNQRLLLWRVVRTLSHDPFPSVATIALQLRKTLAARSFVAPPTPAFGFQSSLQGSPLISSAIGPLNTVPEQSLNDYAFSDHLNTPSTGTASRSSWDGPPPAASAHSRGKSDGALTFDTVVTRPRSRPVSEIEHPPHHTGAPNINSNNLAASASILGVMGAAANSGPGSSQHRASSPSLAPPQQLQRVSSANPSPAASPKHNPTAAPGQSARKSMVGHRLVFDDNTLSASSIPQATPQSSIYARSSEYFIAPVGAAAPAGSAVASTPVDAGEDPEVVLDRLLSTGWRHKRNVDLMRSASQIRNEHYDVTDCGTFDQIGVLGTGFDQISSLLFHPFENMLCVSEKRQIAIWDVKEQERINIFSNDNARGTKISAVTWINEQHQSLLLAGSDDGVVRLWKNVHLPNTQPEIVSAWLAVRSMKSGTGVGLVLDWQQETGHLLAAGPVDSIRVWDVEREICVLDLPVDSDSYVSSVCSMSQGGVVFSGCGDGVVRMFDLRADNHQIHTVSKHSGSVVTVRVQRSQGGDRYGSLVSGGVNGDIHVSDTRMLGGPVPGTSAVSSSSGGVASLAAFEKPVSLDALAIHDHAPVLGNGEPFEAESILARRGSGPRAQYLVKWLGYPHWESTWEPATNLSGAPVLVAEYERGLADQASS